MRTGGVISEKQADLKGGGETLQGFRGYFFEGVGFKFLPYFSSYALITSHNPFSKLKNTPTQKEASNFEYFFHKLPIYFHSCGIETDCVPTVTI